MPYSEYHTLYIAVCCGYWKKDTRLYRAIRKASKIIVRKITTVMETTTAPVANKNRLVMRTTAAVTTITVTVAKKTTSTVVTSTARLEKQHLLSEIV